MTKIEELKKFVGEYYIRCLTKEEFGKILELFESKLSIDEWDKFDTYTIYDDFKNIVLKSFKGCAEILAKDVIKEFENNWLIEDGEIIKPNSTTEFRETNKNLENILGKNFNIHVNKTFPKILERPTQEEKLEKIIDEGLEKVSNKIKDSFQKTKEEFLSSIEKEPPTLEKWGDGQKITKEELEDELSKNVKWDKQEELLTNMKNYNDGENECIKKMYEIYPNLLNEFKIIQRQQLELFCKKMLDYGISNISAGTLLSNEEEINFALSGIWFRINDKIQRFKNLIFFKKGNDVEEESLEDTFLDISNYGTISKLVKEGNWKK